MTKIINNIEEVINDFDLFIVDIWGVVHNDGANTFPGVLDILAKIRSLQKKVVFLSNAPRRIQEIQSVLAKIGITNEYYDKIHTSGEETRELLKDSAGKYGKKCFAVGNTNNLLEDTNLTQVQNIDDADFILGVGFLNNKDGEFERKNLEIYNDIIEEGLKRNLLWICPNPDIIVKTINGELYCPGAVAAIYEQRGGKVVYSGKPYKQAYERIFSWFNEIPSNRIIAIGDGIKTDIKGANNAGISSVLIVESGIHANALLDESTGLINQDKLSELSLKSNSTPTYATYFFK